MHNLFFEYQNQISIKFFSSEFVPGRELKILTFTVKTPLGNDTTFPRLSFFFRIISSNSFSGTAKIKKKSLACLSY